MASGMLMKRPRGRVFDPSDPLGYPTGGAKQPTGLLGGIKSGFKKYFPEASEKISSTFEGITKGMDDDWQSYAMLSSQADPSEFNPAKPVRVGTANVVAPKQYGVTLPRRRLPNASGMRNSIRR